MIVASFLAPRFDKWGVDYRECLAVLQASCDRLGLRHVVISDREIAGFETARFDLPENLMQAIISGQGQFLAQTTEPVLFVGVDCILTRDPMELLGEFDLAVTVHPFGDCVLNTGAIAVADGPRCAPIWQRALARNPVEWGEDQKVLKAELDPVPSQPGYGIRRDFLVRFAPCRDFNWAPEAADDDAGMPLVVHFRGNRKPWMADWAKRFL